MNLRKVKQKSMRKPKKKRKDKLKAPVVTGGGGDWGPETRHEAALPSSKGRRRGIGKPNAPQVRPGGERAADTAICLPPLAGRGKKQQRRRNYDRSGPWGPLKGLAVTGLRSQQGNKALPSPHGARKENQRRASKQSPSGIYCTYVTFYHSLELKKTG